MSNFVLKVMLVSIQINDTLKYKCVFDSSIRNALPFNIPFVEILLLDVTL